MSSPLAGAEIITFLAPPLSMCARALAASVNRPVDSTTTSTPRSRHGSFPGSRSASTLYAFAVDIHGAVARADVAVVRSVVAVVLEEVRALCRAGQIVDGRDLDLRMTLHERLGKVAADPAKAVNSDAHEPRLPGRLEAPLHAAQALRQPGQCRETSAHGGLSDGWIAAAAQFRQ